MTKHGAMLCARNSSRACCLGRSLHALRDRMQDWAEMLDVSIRVRQCTANTFHLEVCPLFVCVVLCV